MNSLHEMEFDKFDGANINYNGNAFYDELFEMINLINATEFHCVKD